MEQSCWPLNREGSPYNEYQFTGANMSFTCAFKPHVYIQL